MSINIGNNNNITNSNIAEKVIDHGTEITDKKSFFEQHPAICGFFISLLAGFILLFNFWDNVITFIEGLF